MSTMRTLAVLLPSSARRPWLGLLCAAWLAAGCATLPAADPDARALELRRFDATVRGDPAALELLLSPDLRYCHSNGRCESRQQYLDALRQGQTTYRSIDLVDLTARRLGSALLIGGRVDIEVLTGGTPQRLKLTYTDVYEWRNGRWLLAAWQSTRLP